MSGRLYFRGPLLSISFACCAAISQAWGIGVSDLLNDPLWAEPDILRSGASLPDGALLPCPVQIDFMQPLTLGAALDISLCNNPQVSAAWGQIKMEAGRLGQARAAYLPTINGSYSRLKNSTTYPATSGIPNSYTIGNQVYGSFNWRLFDFGGRSSNNESAIQLLAAAIFGHDATLQKVMTSTIQAYFDVVTGKAMYDARRQMANAAENSLNATKRREMKGVAALNDSLQASTALAKARLNESRAGGDYHKALGVLKQSMGIPANTQIFLTNQTEFHPSADIKDLNAW